MEFQQPNDINDSRHESHVHFLKSYDDHGGLETNRTKKWWKPKDFDQGYIN